MKKLMMCLCSAALLFSATACEETSEEKLFGYIEDVASIVINADNCETAANRINQYTDDNKRNMERDIKELYNRSEDQAAKEETKDRLKSELDDLNEKYKKSKCSKDVKVNLAIGKFTAEATRVIVGSAIGEIGNEIIGK